MTLITYGNSETQRRCDAHCHDATTPACECECICGGANHGVGLAQAQENTRELADEWMTRWKKDHPDDTVSCQLPLL